MARKIASIHETTKAFTAAVVTANSGATSGHFAGGADGRIVAANPVAGEVRSRALTNGTDQTATITAELAALYAAGGGTLTLPAGEITITGQLVIPNDGGGIFPTDAQLQPSLTIAGQGGWHSGQEQLSPVIGGTRLILTYTNAAYYQAKIVTRGLGRLTLRDITFKAPTVSDTTPILMTTNTTMHVTGCTFMGSGARGTCTMDAIVLGGTKKKVAGVEVEYDDPDSAFQGYGTVISGCYFDRIRRTVYGRSFCNHVVIRDNFIEKTCGTNLVNGACIEINGGLDATLVSPNDYCTGDQILHNYLNGLGYYYQIKLVKATRCVVLGNGSPDPQPNLISMVRCESSVENGTTYVSMDNNVIANHCQVAPHMSEDTASANRNTLLGTGGEAEQGYLAFPVTLGGTSTHPSKLGYATANKTLIIQHDTAPAVGTKMIWAKRAADDAADPSEDIFYVLQEGSVTLRGASAGEITFKDAAGATKSVFESNGTKWRAVGQSGMVIDVGPVNSWLDVKAYGARFYDQNSGPLRVRTGAGKDGIDLGPASDVTIQRDATASLAVNAPVKTKSSTTALRPAAATVGAGAMIYDSDLAKMILSNGTAWTNLDGTALA